MITLLSLLMMGAQGNVYISSITSNLIKNSNYVADSPNRQRYKVIVQSHAPGCYKHKGFKGNAKGK